MAGELTDAELAARRHGIGGSDAGPILGVGYGTPFTVWMDKVYGHRIEATAVMRRGHDLEPIVAAKAGDRLGAELVPVVGQRWHPDVPWLFATMDYEAPGQRLLVECKAPEWRHQGAEWGPDGDPTGLPLVYDIQAHHQMAADPDIEVVVVAALFVDTWQLRLYPVERDMEIQGMILDQLGAFWWDHVDARVPPPITDPTRDLASMSSMPLRAELAVDLDGVDGDGAELVRAWVDATEARKAAEDAEKRHKAEIRRRLGEAACGTVHGETAVRVSEHYRGNTLIRRLMLDKKWRT